ncbi:MAG: hypothetical protein VX289_01660, partial [Candidatus Poribacteria bacterium]|nr:hypothetical protein [Candidatus Poribacteria bacterium]
MIIQTNLFNRVRRNSNQSVIGMRANLHNLLLFSLLFVLVGCTTFLSDNQSDLPFEDSRSKKVQQVELSLISNEVNCISTDSRNVWIATVAGVSRWDGDREGWFHYTKEDGLA